MLATKYRVEPGGFHESILPHCAVTNSYETLYGRRFFGRPQDREVERIGTRALLVKQLDIPAPVD